MAPRFLVIVSRGAVSPDELLNRVPTLPGLILKSSQTGLVAYGTADMPILDCPGGGIIAGHLFTRGERPRAIEDRALLQVVAPTVSIQTLLRSTWGSYLAFLPGRTDSRFMVMREPSGGLPCVHIETADSGVFSSDIDLLIAAGFLTPRIGWTSLARHLAYPDLKSPDTCLEGVSELMPGHAMSVEDRPVPQRPVWSPWDYCTPFAVSEDAATDALEKAVDGCVSAWAGRFRHILLGISGGLDSSIVAECAAPHVQLSLLTMHTGEAEGDERRYARILAQHLSLALTDDEHRLERVDLSMPTSAHLPRPVAFGFGQSERRTKRDLVEQLGIDALFSGIGGDNVLCSLQSASPIVDRWRAEGPGEALLRTFGDVRTLTGASVWQVASAAVRRAIKPTAYRWPPADTFLGPASKAQCHVPASHPWLRPPRNALPGKAAHVAMILRVMATNDGFPRATFPAQINPLISQPIIETCLAIPTWMWVAEGRDRAIARRAFERRLPSALTQRRTKGGPDSFAYRVMEGNKHRLADILVNGVLTSHGLIDPAAIAAALPSGRPIRPSDHMRLASLAEAEVWARHWT